MDYDEVHSTSFVRRFWRNRGLDLVAFQTSDKLHLAFDIAWLDFSAGDGLLGGSATC